MLHKSGATALNLDAAARFLLDMLDIGAPVTHDLSSEIKAWYRFEVDGDLLLWPFALHEWLAVISVKYHKYLLYQTHHAQQRLVLAV